MRPIPVRLLPHTVTLYNQMSKTEYQTAILSHVYFEERRARNINRLGAAVADSVLLVIDRVHSIAKTRGGIVLTYLPPKAFAAETDKSALWTLQDGVKDFFVLGETGSTLDINEVKAVYQTFAVNAVDTLRDGADIHHWEVSGK